MPVAKKYNMAGQCVGEVELSEAVFGAEPNGSVLHESVKNYLANQRQGTQSALTKGEVSYSTKKPLRGLVGGACQLFCSTEKSMKSIVGGTDQLFCSTEKLL